MIHIIRAAKFQDDGSRLRECLNELLSEHIDDSENNLMSTSNSLNIDSVDEVRQKRFIH